jgi:hypothetical protein
MRLIDADALLQRAVPQGRSTPLWVSNIVIEDAPTIDAESVRHGKWIECESENGIHIHKCSECGNRDMYKGTFRDWNGREFSFYYKRQYCPNCGAKMDEVEK